MLIIGWDVSTSAIGICVRRGDGTTVGFSTIFPSGNTPLEKHLSAERQIRDFFQGDLFRHGDEGPVENIIEERLGGFTGGRTSQQTLMALAAMNAVVSFVLRSYGQVTHIAPVTTKRITGLKVPKGGDKKLAVIGLVRSREPSFPYAETRSGNYVKGTDDMADAWLLAEAGRLVLNGEATLGQQKKAGGRRGKAGKAKGDRTPEG